MSFDLDTTDNVNNNNNNNKKRKRNAVIVKKQKKKSRRMKKSTKQVLSFKKISISFTNNNNKNWYLKLEDNYIGKFISFFHILYKLVFSPYGKDAPVDVIGVD